MTGCLLREIERIYNITSMVKGFVSSITAGQKAASLLQRSLEALAGTATNMAESLSLRGTLEGHAGWVTSITTPLDPNSDIILSSSRCCNTVF